MSVGSRIADRRKQLGWTQKELADRMGYTNKTTITKIESEANDVTQSKIIKFAEVLDVPVSFLMEWEDDGPQTIKDPAVEVNGGITEEERLLLDLFRRLPEELRQTFLIQLRALAAAQEKEQ